MIVSLCKSNRERTECKNYRGIKIGEKVREKKQMVYMGFLDLEKVYGRS